MQQRRVGDIEVSAIGLGGMPMSVRETNDVALGIRTVHRALDEGVTLIDTADVYTPDDAPLGHNEEVIAKALSSYGAAADDVLVATKGGMTRDGADWGTDGRPEALRAACEGSLRRLGVDAIGLYQHHRPDPEVPYAETMGGLKQLLDDGLIIRAGISNADPDQIRVAADVLGDGLVSVQNEFSPKYRDSEPELALCADLGIAFLPWSPLGGMSQAGELGDRFGVFAEVAKRYDVSAQQVCLAWQLAKSPVVLPIPGASRPESIADSVRAVELSLEPEDLEALDAA
ncbi:MAG: Putative oxidoreductase [uncultured Nocardioidaceae bacterium]|uniref:Oxidoreductase n=1 Tax=uncultured Nocardioidaceae bacterium TaxID=253824 RepID=A0A6J4M8C8_9ACTN|nr:MAG: Putative oxidoreductase [uncultured Nocardioidaceae bacterium]